MAFPQTQLPIKVELDLAGAWASPTDITSQVYGRDQPTINRGRSAEGSTVDPSSLSLTLNNRDGRFSPRNPTGPYYGTLGRNTPVRVSVLAGSVRATVPYGSTGLWTTPDSAGTSITGDIDIRVDLTPPAWRFPPGLARRLAYKWASPSQQSWYVELGNDGLLRLFWSTTGADGLSATSTMPVPLPVTGRRAVRATLDVNNGAAGNTVTFYTSDTLSGTWTQLGDPVVQGGTTSIFNSTAVTTVYLGDWATRSPQEFYAAEVRNGIAGSVVASPTFTSQAEGATSFADAQANTWTATGSTVTARRYRFHGEVSAWPQKWDSSGQDVWVPVEAAGILRRLGQGAAKLRSPLYRGISSLDSLLAYWPAEDATGSTSLASALPSVPGLTGPMIFTGAPTLAAYTDFAASEAIPALSSSATLRGNVAAYTGTGEFQVRFLLAVPSGGTTNGAIIAALYDSGTVYQWNLVYGTGGTLQLASYDSAATLLSDSGAVAFAVNGKRIQVSIELVQDGADVDWRFSTLNDDGTSIGYTTGTLAGRTIGTLGVIRINPGSSSLTDVAIGHIYAQSEQTDLADVTLQLQGFAGETAGDRIVRLCDEESIAVDVLGDPAETREMGVQPVGTLLELLREAEAVDGGILHEPTTLLGLHYRSREALYNQPARATLSYSGDDLYGLEPVDDDQLTTNDITVARKAGTSYRAVQETGTLNTAAPPAGVGRYDSSQTLALAEDGQVADSAGWLLRLGTIDEPRYPAVAVHMSRANIAGSVAMLSAVADLDLGDLMAITGTPAWLPPDGISALVIGARETLAQFEWVVTLRTQPGVPWTVGVYDDAAYRYSPDGSTLAEDLTTTETGVDVATPSGPLWTTDGAEVPFDIVVAGERMTVTAISGGSSPQTFTVTRSVNGVVKAQSTSAAVELFAPACYGL